MMISSPSGLTLTGTLGATIGKNKVMDDFSKFTSKWNDNREKRVIAG